LQPNESAVGGPSETDVIYRFGDYEFHAERLELRRDGSLVQADTLVLRLLACLLERAGRLVTKDELVGEVWHNRAIGDNAITVAMARLRKTLGRSQEQGEFVVTVYGRGYRFTEQVTVHREPSAKTAPFTVQPVNGGSAPFVGRAELLSQLHRACREVRAGRGRACLLMGEPGIGKTRAVEVFESQVAPAQLRVAWGYCHEGGDTPPLAPFLRILRELIANETDERLLRTFGLDPEQLATDPRTIGADKQIPSPDLTKPGRHRRFDDSLRALSLIAERTPLLLVIEDLHRADAGTLELFGQLLDELARTKILVVATLRTAVTPLTQLSRVVGHRNCERMSLTQLPAADVERYVSSVLDDPSGRLAKAVFAKSEGNPFFMVELARQLSHSLDPDPAALNMHEAALDLIKQRVAQLDADARGVLSAAAVMGRSFELSRLSLVCARDPAALMLSLDAALGAQVLVAAPGSTTAFAFGHELLRSVLYDALTPAERRRWHIRIAEVLEQQVNSGEPIPPSELAYHLYSALPQSDLRKTVQYCREAAKAASVYGNPDVVRYLRHALEALSLMPAPSVRLRLELLLTSCVFARGSTHTEYITLVERALCLAREHGDAWTMVRAAYMLNPHPGFVPRPGGAAALTHALSLLANAPPNDPYSAAPRTLGLAALACSAPVSYDAERATHSLQQARTLARLSNSIFARTSVLMCQLYLEGGPAHDERTQQLLTDIEALARAHPRELPVVPAELILHRTLVLLQRGDMPALARSLEQLTAYSRQLQHHELVWHSERWRVLFELHVSPSDTARSRLERLHESARRQRFTGHEPFCAFDRAVVLGTTGVRNGALLELDPLDQTALATAVEDPPSIWAMKLRALATAGLTQHALAALRTVPPQRVAALPCDRDYLGTLGHLVRASLLLRADEYYTVLYDLLSPYAHAFAAHVSFYSEGPVSQLLGMLATALGRSGAALRHFEVAIEQCERAQLTMREAEVRLQFAECARSHAPRRRQRALAEAKAALTSAQALGAEPLGRAAAELCAELSGE